MSRFILQKMHSSYQDKGPVSYALKAGEELIPLNPYLGKTLELKATGEIFCRGCARKITKSYQQGYCFPCTQTLAATDLCSVRPERCHFRKGTCRDEAWGTAHCMIPHTVYLANSSGLKIGMTRAHHRLTRWIDQGAVQAIALAVVPQRLDAGMMETMLKEFYPDQTNWRLMLQGKLEKLDLEEAREEALAYLPITLAYTADESEAVTIEYPVLSYPDKVRSLNLAKEVHIAGTLLGIKGQYWILDTGVINIRSFAGYEVEFTQAQ